MFVSEEVIYCPSEKVRDFDLRNENKIYGKNVYLCIIHEDTCLVIISKTQTLLKATI